MWSSTPARPPPTVSSVEPAHCAQNGCRPDLFLCLSSHAVSSGQFFAPRLRMQMTGVPVTGAGAGAPVIGGTVRGASGRERGSSAGQGRSVDAGPASRGCCLEVCRYRDKMRRPLYSDRNMPSGPPVPLADRRTARACGDRRPCSNTSGNDRSVTPSTASPRSVVRFRGRPPIPSTPRAFTSRAQPGIITGSAGPPSLVRLYAQRPNGPYPKKAEDRR
jgi:hypothetical protein